MIDIEGPLILFITLADRGSSHRVGNGISFRKNSAEWTRNGFLLFRGRKCSFRSIPISAEEPIPKIGTEWNGTEFRGKNKFYKTARITRHNDLSKVVFSDFLGS